MHTQNRGKLGKFDYLLVENIDNLGKFDCKTRVNYPVITVSPMCIHKIRVNQPAPNEVGGKSLNLISTLII